MKEEISALLDGELEPRAVSPCLERLGKSPELSDDWGLYQLIGDHLRGAPTFSLSFPARFSARLAQEPTVLLPYRLRLGGAVSRSSRLIIPAAVSLFGVAAAVWAALSLSAGPGRQLMASVLPAVTPASQDYFQSRPGGGALPSELEQGATTVEFPAEHPQKH